MKYKRMLMIILIATNLNQGSLQKTENKAR